MSLTCWMCMVWQGSLRSLDDDKDCFSHDSLSSPALVFEGSGCQAGFD